MVKTFIDNLPEGIKCIEVFYYDENKEDIEKLEDAKIYIYSSYDFNDNRIEEGYGYTLNYINELAKEDPSILEDIDLEEDSIFNVISKIN